MTFDLEDRVLGLVASGPPRGFCWLDSGPGGRSIVGLQPCEELRGGTLDVIDQLAEARAASPDATWIGWLNYELGAQTQGVARTGAPGGVVCLRRFEGVVELRSEHVVLRGDRDCAAATQRALEAVPPLNPSAWPLHRLEAELDPQVHRDRVARALEHIVAGESYQINVAQPFCARWRGTAGLNLAVAQTYQRLRRDAPAPMGGLIEDGGRFILSNSPETLLRWNGDSLTSSPIKGTRPRSADPAADRLLREDLLASAKDAAEHVMIVDLVRNDLGQVARPGTVRAPSAHLVSLPTVHHLVTDVSATVRPDVSMREVLAALLPAGSVTGAPKRRAVELISEIEAAPRGIYCGALVLVEPAGCTLSVAIRTAVADAAGLSVFGGGGVVVDSDPEEERVETVAKVAAFAGDAGLRSPASSLGG